MKLRYFEYRKGRVEIIPMIDVMLFLLVFFIIVTLQMIPDAGVDLQLPQASQVQHLPHPKVTVNLLADGTMMVKQHPLTADALTVLLFRDGNPAKTQVTIAADKKVPFQFFITAMDAARKAGVTDIGVAAQPLGPVANPSQPPSQPQPTAPAVPGQPAPPAAPSLPGSGKTVPVPTAAPAAPTASPAPTATPAAPASAAPGPEAAPATTPSGRPQLSPGAAGPAATKP